MPRTWKSALAPFLAGIPQRTGFVGEARFGLLNDLRWGENALPRMVDRCAGACAAERQEPLPANGHTRACRAGGRGRGLAAADRHRRPIAALRWRWRPGAVGPSKRWPTVRLCRARPPPDREGCRSGSWAAPAKRRWPPKSPAPARPTRAISPARICATPSWRWPPPTSAVSNDSGLLHVAAAIGTPAIGIFGPTSPWHWAPLNPLAAVVETANELPCRPCHKPTCRMGHHLCMRDIAADRVVALTMKALG